MTIDRRTLLAGASGVAAFAIAGGAIDPASAARITPIGLQLYTVRQLFRTDPVGTLETVARTGYREIEFGGGGYEAMDHAMLRGTMDRLGLHAPSIHVGYDDLRGSFERSVKMAKTLGADTIVLPAIPDTDRTQAGWQSVLPTINRIAADLKRAGLGFAYHNHDFEFTNRPGGISLYDRLLTGTDPALVRLELDLYWAAYAGENPASLIERLSGRIFAYHVKDMRPDRSMAAVGKGGIDFAALFMLKGSAGVRHFYVENDQAPAPYIPDIVTSFQALRRLRS